MGATLFEEPIRIISNPDPKPMKMVKTVASDFIVERKQEEAFYLCNLGDIIKKYQEWKVAMPRVKPFYAVKCNDDEMVLRILAGLGAGFDCASKVEMGKVLGVGVHANEIIFANPAKQASHIRAAEELNVTTMTFDNVNELHKIKKLHPHARLVVRIRCDDEKAICQLGMKFGVLVQDAPILLTAAKELGLNVVGVSFHVGSGCMNPPVFQRAIASASWLFNLAREVGYNFSLLDIGGGFPGNTGTDIMEIASVVNESVDQFFPEGCGVEIIAEPGRYMVASAFTLITQIHSVREVNNETETQSFMYYINDGVYGSFNCVLYDHAVVTPQTLIESSGELTQCSVWGPTCDGIDQVCSNILLPKMTMGDWLVFHDMGAYTVAAAGTFNGFPLPSVHYIATDDAWNDIKEYFGYENLIMENVPVFMKAGVGCNRDAVGWGIQTVPHPSLNNGMVNYEDGIITDEEPSDSCSESENSYVLSTPSGIFFEYSQTDIPAQ